MGETKSHCILCNDLIENADIHARCDAVHDAHLKKAIIIPAEDIKSRSKNTLFENVKSDAFLQKKQGADQADNNKVNVRKTEPEIPVITLHEKENVKQNAALLEKHSAIKAVDVNSKKNVLGNGDEKQNELLEDGIVQASDNNISLEPKEFFCSVCYIKIHANDLNSHASGAKHKLNEKLDFHYLLEYSTETNEIKCKVCNTFFHTKLINVHIMNSDHAYNYNALLAANKMMKKENNINCDACIAFMRVGNELLHINSAKHKMLLLKTKAPIAKPITESVCEKVKEKNDTQHFCDVCQAQVPNNAYNISTHYNGSRHKKNFAIHLSGKVTEQGNDKIVQADKNTVGQSSNASDKTKIPVERNGTEETVLEKTQNKFDSYKAAVNSRAILDEGMQGEKNNKLVAVANEEKTTAGKEAHKLYNVTQETSGNDNIKTATASEETVGGFFEITSNPKELMCRICNVIIPNKSTNVSEHLAGYNHCNNFTILMEKNQLQLVGNLYFCNHCRVYVTIGNQFNHISERTHVVNVAKTVANMLVEVFVQKSDSATDIKSANDSSSDVQTPSTSNVSAQSSSASQPKIHTYFEMKLSDKPYEVLCQVCNVKVPNSVSTLNMHVEGQRHNAQLKEILLKNKITEEDGRFKCSACFMDLSRFELFKHIRKNYHLTSLEKNESNCIVNGYCNVCDESISDGKMDEHILTEQHLTNQKQKTQSINHVCEICDVQLTNNISNINEHNNGFQHKNIIKIMDENNIEIREGKCYCKSCEVYITYKSIQGHVGMSQHLILMGSDVSQ